MAWYYQGSITIAPGSNVVTGTGTQWLANLYGIGEGQALVIGAERLEIMYVDSDTSIRLALAHAQGYTGSYHIETSYAGTGGDASRQISAALRRLTTLTFDWAEWMTSDAATIIATDAFGHPVEIATYKSLSTVDGEMEAFKGVLALDGFTVKDKDGVTDVKIDSLQLIQQRVDRNFKFLQEIEKWMTDTGQVEIELPNGQKVTLDSVKAMNEAISKIPKVVQATGQSVNDVISQKGVTDAINAAKPGDASVTQKGVVQLSASVGTSTTTVPHEKAISDALGKKADINAQGSASKEDVYKSGYMRDGAGTGDDTGLMSQNSTYDFRKMTSYARWQEYPIGLSVGLSDMTRYQSTGYGGLINFRAWEDQSGISSCFQIISTSNGGFATIVPQYFSSDNTYYYSGPIWHRTTRNTTVDGNGFIKVASPIIRINHNGHYETNDESEGAEVRRTGTGQYHITGILGYNSDVAWGVNGGISVPKDNNGLELVYVDDRVLEDGSIIIETCHRQHAHLPERFQNWRLKEVTTEGERIFYQDGEPCDLPESTRLDVRVEMPQGSVWNVKQHELAEQMEREQAEREAQEAAEQAGESEE